MFRAICTINSIFMSSQKKNSFLIFTCNIGVVSSKFGVLLAELILLLVEKEYITYKVLLVIKRDFCVDFQILLSFKTNTAQS